MDFGALPPEINSGLMHAGPGSAPMLAAATAWQALAAELRSAATGYGSVIVELADAGWHGPSSAAMTAAAAPYVSWMHSTAAQAEQAGMQAAAAAAAHEAAFAATVPPPVIMANRALLMALTATNFLGQHTPAIAATEAQYGEMWAQDAAAMYAYSAASATATLLSPLAGAPATTNPAGLASGAIAAGDAAVGNLQGVATQAAMGLSAIPSALSSSGSSLLTEFGSSAGEFTGLLSMPLGEGAGMGAPGSGGMAMANPVLTTTMRAPGVSPVMPVMERPAPALPTMRAPEMLSPAGLMPAATMGQAAPVGGLSVPSSWPTTAPEAAVSSGAPLASAGPMLTPRGIPAGQVGGMEARAFGTPLPARASVLPQLVG